MRHLVALAVSILVTVPVAAQTVTMPSASETGSSYKELDATTRGWYVRGLVDGLLGAVQFGGEEGLAAAFEKCMSGMTSVEIEALVDKYVADHPAQLHKGMHALVAIAITDSCPDYTKELRKSDFWRRTLGQAKPPQ